MPGRWRPPRTDPPSVAQGYPADRRRPPPVATLHAMTTPPEKPALRLGGMALENGLLVHGPGYWAAAIRHDDGTVRVASGARPASAPRARWSASRSSAASRRWPRCSCAAERPARRCPAHGSPSSARPSSSPVPPGRSPRRRPPLRPPLACHRGGARGARFALLPALVALRSRTSPRTTAPSTRRSAPTRAGVAPEEAPKEHDRCGSHLVGPLMAASASPTSRPRGCRGATRARRAPAASLAALGVAVEVFGWMYRNAAHPAARARAPRARAAAPARHARAGAGRARGRPRRARPAAVPEGATPS